MSNGFRPSVVVDNRDYERPVFGRLRRVEEFNARFRLIRNQVPAIYVPPVATLAEAMAVFASGGGLPPVLRPAPVNQRGRR